MYAITATENLRRVAETVVFANEALVPTEGKKDCWRIPFQDQPELLTQEARSCIHAFRTTKHIEIIEKAKQKGQDWQPVGLEFLLNHGIWHVQKGESVAAITLPFPLASQIRGLDTTLEVAHEPEGSPNKGEAPSSSKQNATTENVQNRPATTKEAQDGTNKAIKDTVPTPKHLPEPQTRRQMVFAQETVDQTVVRRIYTLELGDTLVLEENDMISAEVGGTFQLVQRYRVKMLPEVIDTQEGTTSG